MIWVQLALFQETSLFHTTASGNNLQCNCQEEHENLFHHSSFQTKGQLSEASWGIHGVFGNVPGSCNFKVIPFISYSILFFMIHPIHIKDIIDVFDSSTSWDRSTTHHKFDPTRVRAHDLQIMTQHWGTCSNHSAIRTSARWCLMAARNCKYSVKKVRNGY